MPHGCFQMSSVHELAIRLARTPVPMPWRMTAIMTKNEPKAKSRLEKRGSLNQFPANPSTPNSRPAASDGP